MKRLVLLGDAKVELREMESPEPGPGQVRIKTQVSALCGSELKPYKGGGVTDGNGGHEAAGVIDALGEGVDNFKVGQRVGVGAVSGCGSCQACQEQKYTWCSNFLITTNMHSEEFVVPAMNCYPLSEDISWQAGVLLSGDGLGVPFHSATKITGDHVKNIAIFGMGPIGLGNVLVQKHAGRNIAAIDISPTRLEAAKALGADHLIDASQGDPVEALKAWGCDIDVCIEAAGRPETLLSCFTAVRTGGTVVMNGEQGGVELSPSDHFIRRDIQAVGSWFYHYAEIDGMMAAYREGLAVEKLVSDEIPFEEVGGAFADFAAGKTAKVLLTYS